MLYSEFQPAAFPCHVAKMQSRILDCSGADLARGAQGSAAGGCSSSPRPAVHSWGKQGFSNGYSEYQNQMSSCFQPGPEGTLLAVSQEVFVGFHSVSGLQLFCMTFNKPIATIQLDAWQICWSLAVQIVVLSIIFLTQAAEEPWLVSPSLWDLSFPQEGLQSLLDFFSKNECW